MTLPTPNPHRRPFAALFSLAVVSTIVLTSLSQVAAQAADWPYWRGPEMNGTAQASGLPDNWDPDGGEGSNLLWKRDDLGGPCTPVVMDGRLYTIQRHLPGTSREGERVVCLDAKTGETIWENDYNVWLSDVPTERIGWSSVVGDPETGNVYALGACDIFQCIDGKTGETLWKVPLHEQFGMLSTYGGRTNFPIIHEDLVIISGIIINWGEYAKPNHRLLAMNKLTGEFVWFSGTRDLPYDTTYSAPSLATIDGQRQLIMGAGDGSVWGFQPRTGKPLWHYELSRRGIFATPLVVGDQVFCSHSEENAGGAFNVMGGVAGLRISGTGDQTKATELWKQFEVVAGYSEPVYVDGKLYLVDDRCKMWVFDSETGEAIVERKGFVGSRQRSALLYADGKIYVTTENGRWAIVEPTEDGFEVLNKGRIRDTGFAGSPIVADGRLYFPSTNTLYCVGTDAGKQTPVVMADSLGTETAVSEDSKIAQVQIVPCEALLQPGQSIDYTVNVFNAIGQQLETPADVSFEVTSGASVDGNTLTADADVAHSGVTVTATVAGATGIARARIVPALPWKFTFDKLSDPPLSWVGARYRHVIRDIDGSPVLTKITTIPKGARSRLWMGPSDLKEYTITADVRGKRTLDQLPDIGLTAHGYVLDLMGQSQDFPNSQQLQIRTWSAQLRMAKTVEFPWQEDKWYRMKFRVDLESEPPATVAVLRGKVWPRDEEEPKEWTITARDEAPNLNSSPGLYGNAKVAELYLDNIEVVPNSDE
ncbi:PQQ-binding-like beta-propeller repeat protein [Stieleria sp. TO1_6]|uniref:outer membrane protein assembly factor BamB family protein n=1 Tax=Stieleria tagensis TaxID=2956795 RepID=UPI00209B54C4|nr:PQQ-binding-like beta-propeller repeat protein [Stieleria tagensis]MCO8122848.1 PQQ-binding-like beta-propeller repeat protein [Stieleria tagensis]